MSTPKYAYRELPKFTNRNQYHYWASATQDAFAERGWMDYLVDPAAATLAAALTAAALSGHTGVSTPEAFTPDPSITARAKAFLTQSIDFKFQSAIRDCSSASQIWSIFLARYGQRSRDDELRLEAELMSLVKLPTQTLDQYIDRFDDLIANIRAQQDPAHPWDDRKVNMHFIRTLELSRIPNEDWKAWTTYLGSTHSTMSYDALQAACRTYYTTHW